MSDNSHSTVFGLSTPGALNLVAGQTGGAVAHRSAGSVNTAEGYAVRNPNPVTGRNVGDMLDEQTISWGWFQGGFRDCTAAHTNVAGVSKADYIPHREPFQYSTSTANPDHVAPARVAESGPAGPANHQDDMTDFDAALRAHDLPTVSFLKAPGYQDGHADDALDGNGQCTSTTAGGTQAMLDGYQDRCGYGPQQPLLVISPFARANAVDHTLTDQTSVLRFIEDSWLGGRRINGSFDHIAGSLGGMLDFQHPQNGRPILDPATGARVGS